MTHPDQHPREHATPQQPDRIPPDPDAEDCEDPEENVPPEPSPEFAHVPFEDVTVVLLFGGGRMNRLARWASRWSQDPELSACPVVVVHRGKEPAEQAEEALAPLGDGVRLVEFATEEERTQEETLAAYAQLCDSINTPWFCFSTPRRRRFRRYGRVLKARIDRELTRVGGLGLHEAAGPAQGRAILLHNRHRGRFAPLAYVWHTVATLGEDYRGPLRDYVGFLALASGTHKLEGVDLRAGSREVELFARVTPGRFNTESRPPWNYRFAVSSPAGTAYLDEPATLERRLDNQGGSRWENVVGRLPLDQIPEGNHRLMIGIVTPHEELRSLRSLTPRPGALAPARTVLLRGSGREGQPSETRYLIHTVEGTRSWITLQRGSGKEALRRWEKALAKKDARMIARGKDGRRMRLARLARLATLPRLRNREVWLIGERADTAQDNGFHLFRHLRETDPEREVYYIIDPESPQYERVRHLGNVVAHSSRQHQLLMLHATVLANAYSIKHMIPKHWNAQGYTRSLAWRVGAHRVYLKHGVHVSPTAVKRGTGGYDLYLSVNPRERAALQESSGYRDQVVETGMPRYDTLVPGPSTRTILFMPTWRRYLVPKLFGPDAEARVPFAGSTYQRFVSGLLTSPMLHDILTRHDYRLQMLPHYNLRQELEDFEFTSDRTEFADTTTHSFQDLIRGCDAFVTDYSSVHFDVAYLGTPIIYTHFDREDYEDGHAVVSWFDHETDGFGPVVHTLAQTLRALDDLLARGCAQDPAYRDRISEAFTFQDHNNCERVVTEIDAMIARARAGQ